VSVGAFLERLWESVTDWLPTLEVMPADHAGVRFRRGKVVKRIDPGLYVYWPKVTTIEEMPVKRQSMRLEHQTLTTADGETVVVGAVVIYDISDVRRALVETENVEDTISDAAQQAVTPAVVNRSFEDLQRDLTGGVAAELKKNAQLALDSYGVRVREAFVADFAKARLHRVLGDGVPLLHD